MVDAIEYASGLLSCGLEKYLDACIALEKCSAPRDWLDRITQQVVLIDSFEKKIRQARIVLSRAKNYSSQIVTINTLPDDMLVCIFGLVTNTRDYLREVDTSERMTEDMTSRTDTQSYDWYSSWPTRGHYSPSTVGVQTMQDEHFPWYPHLLTHVCTRWRRITLDSPALWAQLDLMTSPDKFSSRLLDRAEAHVTRAGSIPLDVRIFDASPNTAGHIPMTKLIDILILAAPQMHGLTIVTNQRFTDIHSSILDIGLAGAMPGLLTRLTLHYRDRDSSHTGVIIAQDDQQAYGYWRTELIQERVDEIMEQVTVLRQHNLYLNWGTTVYEGVTKAYHGLVELSLTSRHPSNDSPTQAQFLGILKSSPALQIIRLGNMLKLGTPDDQTKEAAILDDLEILHVGHFDHDVIGATLCCISPGSKPLRLMIEFWANKNPLTLIFERELAEFLFCSNVTRLELQGPQNHDWTGNLISKLPDLDTLALEGIVSNDVVVPVEPSLPRINTLHIAESRVYVNGLQRMIEDYSIQAVTFWKSLLLDGSDDGEQAVDIGRVDLGVDIEVLDPYGPGPIESLQEGVW